MLPLLHLSVIEVGQTVPSGEQGVGIATLQASQALPAGLGSDSGSRLVFPVGERDHLSRAEQEILPCTIAREVNKFVRVSPRRW